MDLNWVARFFFPSPFFSEGTFCLALLKENQSAIRVNWRGPLFKRPKHKGFFYEQPLAWEVSLGQRHS